MLIRTWVVQKAREQSKHGGPNCFSLSFLRHQIGATEYPTKPCTDPPSPAMEQPLDFSFHKGNPLAVADELESPKPMPKPPTLPLVTDASAEQSSDQNACQGEDPSSVEERVPSSPSVANMAVEVLETLSISPAPVVSTEQEAMPLDSSLPSTSAAGDDCNVPSVSPVRSPSEPVQFSEQPVSPSKPRPRAKVPLERGFTQMDWLKLTRSEPDLAGLKGGTSKKLIPMEEVKLHQSQGDAWTVLRGRVYNISPYLRFHPGGLDMLMKGAGKDCTALFNKYHSWVNAEFLLEKCLVGYLDVEQQRDLAQYMAY